MVKNNAGQAFVSTITIPALGSSPLCPVKALSAMFRLLPATSNEPLSLYSRQGSLLPLTDAMAKKHLQRVSQLLHFSRHFTFHDFMRGGSSDAVWRYIQLPPSATSAVSSAFSSHLYA